MNVFRRFIDDFSNISKAGRVKLFNRLQYKYTYLIQKKKNKNDDDDIENTQRRVRGLIRFLYV